MKAVIFDMDGVLVNSEPHHFEIEKEIFAGLGFSIDEDDFQTFVGMSAVKFWGALKERFSLKQDIDWLIEHDNKIRIEYFASLDHLDPVPGIPKLLAELKSEGIKIALASSSHPGMIEIVVKKLGIIGYFDFIISGHEVEHGKPAPDIFISAGKKLGTEAAECLVIEDSKNGVTAAKAAGMFCLGYINPDSGNQDLSAADSIIDSFVGLTVPFLKQV